MRQGYVILLQYPNSPPRLLLFAGRQIWQQQLSQFSSPCCIIRSTSRQKPRSLRDSVDSTARQTRWNRKTVKYKKKTHKHAKEEKKNIKLCRHLSLSLSLDLAWETRPGEDTGTRSPRKWFGNRLYSHRCSDRTT